MPSVHAVSTLSEVDGGTYAKTDSRSGRGAGCVRAAPPDDEGRRLGPGAARRTADAAGRRCAGRGRPGSGRDRQGQGRRVGRARAIRGGQEREGRLRSATEAVDRRAGPPEEAVRVERPVGAGGPEHPGGAGSGQGDRSQARLSEPDDRGGRGRAEGGRGPFFDGALRDRAVEVPRDAGGERAPGGSGQRRRDRQAGGGGSLERGPCPESRRRPTLEGRLAL